jgi:dUTP pyrophosphatase
MTIVPSFVFALVDGFDSSFLPQRTDPVASGWDVRAAITEDLVLEPFQRALIPLGFRTLMPAGWWLSLNPRSSTFAKKHLNCLVGVLDESWEGQSMMAVQYLPVVTSIPTPTTLVCRISPGDKIGQIIPVVRQEMEVQEVSNEGFDRMCKERGLKRGAAGFGSSGVK